MESTLKSFKLKEAWTFLFKEKKWGFKLLIPLLPGLVFGTIAAGLFIPATFIVFAADSRPSADLFASAGVLGAILLLCLCCVLAIYVVVAAVVNSWYEYEYTKASLEDRESVLITKENKIDVLKKAGKLVLVNTIYNIPTGLIIGLFYALIFIGGTSPRTSYPYGFSNSRTISGAGLLLVCCLFLFIVLIVVPFNFYIVQTAKVNLIKTNTFREAFRVRTIFALAKKNFVRLSMYLGVIALFVVVYIVISFVLSILGIIPLVGLCLIPFQIILGLATWYFGLFANPYMMGKVYKEVK